MDSGEKIEAVVHIHRWKYSLHKKGVIAFERGYLFITIPKQTIFNISPKDISRKDLTTLRVNSGFWNNGWVTLAFDCQEDTDRVEGELRKILPPNHQG